MATVLLLNLSPITIVMDTVLLNLSPIMIVIDGYCPSTELVPHNERDGYCSIEFVPHNGRD